MIDPEVRKFLKDEIRRHLNIVLSGVSGANTEEHETIGNLFPGMPDIEKRPVSHPYGYASRAKNGTIQVNARMGDHVGNRIVISHRDANRPKDLAEGESVIYSSGGLKVYLRNGKIQIGSETSSDPVVLYNELKTLMESILTHVMAHTHIGNMGFETSAPLNNADFTTDKNNIPTIASGKVFTEK